MLAWLQSSRTWTALHHVEVITAARARELLRGGADLHAGLGEMSIPQDQLLAAVRQVRADARLCCQGRDGCHPAVRECKE